MSESIKIPDLPMITCVSCGKKVIPSFIDDIRCHECEIKRLKNLEELQDED